MTRHGMLSARLEKARIDLLDISTRNRLINTPRHQPRTRTIEIVVASSDQVFEGLVVSRKALTFLPADPPAAQPNSEAADPARPGGLPLGEPGAGPAEADCTPQTEEASRATSLPTRLPAEQLQKRLLGMYYDAATFEEEQGVGIFYLALGFLEWYESESSDKPRHAPLLLVPVDLKRATAGSRLRVAFREDELGANVCLQAMLKEEFSLLLPELPPFEELSPTRYFAAVRQSIAQQPRWKVHDNDIVLGFFSFAKFLMYRDLDPATWPEEKDPLRHPLISGLLQQGFPQEPPLCGPDDPIDPIISAADSMHVVDADSSQSIAIEEARRGRHLVIQGPPGTGKSQTIVNLVAAAVEQGKRVLFVAEKMAALNVVKDRLDAIGLGDLCLELHSHKSVKRAVLAELSRTLQLGAPRGQDFGPVCERLERLRERLNRHAALLNQPFESSGTTPFQVLGQLVRLRAEGVAAPPYALDGAGQWAETTRSQRRQLLAELVLHLQEVGNPARHPWRGTGLTTPLLPGEMQRLLARIAALREVAGALLETSQRLAGLLRLSADSSAISVEHARALARLAHTLLAAPQCDRRALASPAWDDSRAQISQAIAAGAELARCRAELQGLVAPEAWRIDLSDERRVLMELGTSYVRWFYPRYRAAVSKLRGLMQTVLPRAMADRLRIIDTLIRGQDLALQLQAGAPLSACGQSAFGAQWQGENSNWDLLGSIDQWERQCREAGLHPRFRQILAGLDDLQPVHAELGRLTEQLEAAMPVLESLVSDLKLDVCAAFECQRPDAIPLAELLERLDAWSRQPEALSRWMGYRVRHHRLVEHGLQDLADQVAQGRVSAGEALDQFELVCAEALLKEMWKRHPELSEFEGQSHEQLIDEFRQMDLQRLSLARQQVALSHDRQIPAPGAYVGEMAIIHREIQKHRNHLPIRRLLQEAGRAVQAIKPVFMMSPMSVAQFLAPGALEFDLLLIDEASQVRPVEALGAVARARQIVVVGDDKQLPPTTFFTKMLEGDDEQDDAEANFADLESILGLCISQGIAQRMLRWHYRSRHHSLIAVSNREFYDNRLFIVPSPESHSGNRALRLHHIADGVFDRGGTARNVNEARAVARAVLEHARRHSNLSLGVGAFSVAQRDAILDELELLRLAHPETEDFFRADRPERFFVKNLENIQGDERDVVFISVGYGRDAHGFMAMSFGPLSREGGERRLNVLITRARQRCEVFSSITADEIDLRRASGRGPAALKVFLQYAATGILDAARPGGRDHDSEFELQVARALADHGFQADLQVGVAGFFIDIAVIDPDRPGRYLLGVECDGAQYHSSRSARDRDRLRQQVLEDRGWRIHRVWSTDWFNRPEEQLRKLLLAIEAARQPVPDAAGNHAEDPAAEGAIERQAARETCDVLIDAIPYLEAECVNSRTEAIHEMAPDRLAQLIERIVAVEAPIHREEVARRAAALCGQLRVGNRILAAVKRAMQVATRHGKIHLEGDFCLLPGAAPSRLRNRERVASASLRRPEMIPPMEIRAAVEQVVGRHHGPARQEVITIIARAMGFRSTSQQLRAAIDGQIDALCRAGQIVERDGRCFRQTT